MPEPIQIPEETDAERTGGFGTPGQGRPGGTPPKLGGTPAYPGWEDDAPKGEPDLTAARPPSRYDPPGEPQDDRPSSTTPDDHAPDEPPSRPGDEPSERHDREPAAPGTQPAGPYGQEPPASGASPSSAYGQEPPESAVPGTSPSSPYGGPPGPVYGAPVPGAAYTPPPKSPGQYPPDWRQPGQPGNGLATAALVLGVASPFLVFVCFIGLLTAILSIVFGIVALVKRTGKGRAITGIVFSALALLIFAALALWFWSVVQDCGQLPPGSVDRCLEERIPWMSPR